VGQHACPLHRLALMTATAMGGVDRFKKRSGRHAVRLHRDGITARPSNSFNFLAIRAIAAGVLER
jgi:hypothetical protein